MADEVENVQYILGPQHAKAYCSGRPEYPSYMIDIINDYMQENQDVQFERAVDVGCGNGQATKLLSKHFKQVLGTDISDLQIAETKPLKFPENVSFSVASAEKLPLSENSVDLVLAAQAAHFFDMEKFYKEVDRVLKSGRCLCLMGYGELKLQHPVHRKELDEALEDFKTGRMKRGLGNSMFENLYANIVLPYPYVRKDLEFVNSMTVAQYTRYISGWRTYQESLQENPDIATNLQRLQDRIMEILDVKTIAEETQICTAAQAFVIIGRKP